MMMMMMMMMPLMTLDSLFCTDIKGADEQLDIGNTYTDVRLLCSLLYFRALSSARERTRSLARFSRWCKPRRWKFDNNIVICWSNVCTRGAQCQMAGRPTGLRPRRGRWAPAYAL